MALNPNTQEDTSLINTMREKSAQRRLRIADIVRTIHNTYKNIRSITQQEGRITTLQTTKERDFEKENGEFVRALDTALASFHVERQAFYSGTFIGNHVHRCLQVYGYILYTL